MRNGVQVGELLAPLRRYAIRSWATAITIAATIAGFAAASGIPGTLPFYVALTALLLVASLVAYTLANARYRFLVFTLVFGPGRAPRDQQRSPYLQVVSDASRPAPALVSLGRAIDHAYEAGLRTLLDGGEPPIAVIASSPRDVSRPHELIYPLFSGGHLRTRCAVDPRAFDIPLPAYEFEREMPEGTHDVDHTLAVKDLAYLPQLHQALLGGAGAAGEMAPFIWPEHCVDLPLLGRRDLVIVGGPDTNFWHGALFEPVWRKFAEPRSAVPLALDLRDATTGLGRYGSRGINVRLAGDLPGIGRTPRVLDERLFPTYAMILACDNPFSRRRPPHWCVFVAGTRSLGTSGAVLALAAAIANMRAGPDTGYASLVETDDPGVRASVSALLCRVTRVERAWRRVGGVTEPREEVPIPTDHPDPRYSDTYIPTEVQFLDNQGPEARWVTLVTRQSRRPA